MDGLINFNKPAGISSAKALYKVRSITGQRKSGHAGTLDPAATGVLLLCLGKGTKLVESLMDLPKVYRATARLDVTSSSFDSDRPLEPVAIKEVPSLGQLRTVLAGFEGEVQQVPPAVSAIKIAGRPAYNLERKGQAVALAARPVQVYWLHLHAYDWPNVDFEMACGRGTYVRSLIRDIGERLGTGGCLTGLCRLAVGPFSVDAGWTADRLAGAKPEEYLLSPELVRERIESRSPPPRPGA